jgi:hypothetical protein
MDTDRYGLRWVESPSKPQINKSKRRARTLAPTIKNSPDVSASALIGIQVVKTIVNTGFPDAMDGHRQQRGGLKHNSPLSCHHSAETGA